MVRRRGGGGLTAFNRIQFLFSCSEMKFLYRHSGLASKFSPGVAHPIERGKRPGRPSAYGSAMRRRGEEDRLTSVFIAKSGFHESGGMILQRPYWLASGEILRMYSMGFFHSSSVGWYVGASCSPCSLSFFTTGSLHAVGWPRLSTEDRSRGGLVMELRGFWGFVGW